MRVADVGRATRFVARLRRQMFFFCSWKFSCILADFRGVDHCTPIAFGALRAPAPTDGELANLRKQQAAFADTTRKIDLQNAWFAAPVLAASALPLLPEAAAQWVFGEGASEASQVLTNFPELEAWQGRSASEQSVQKLTDAAK